MGAEHRNSQGEKFEWWLRCDTGAIYCSDMEAWEPYLENQRLKTGDKVSLVFEGETLTYYVNDESKGVAF